MKKILIGFTVLAVLAWAIPVLAVSNDIEVENDNYADVDQTVVVKADTGFNDANGGNGGAGGDTGFVKAKGAYSSATSGNGGAGGTGGEGGIIVTGNAYAKAKVITVTNTNYTKIKAPCDACVGEIEVENDDNDATIDNDVIVKARTGYNDANGGLGGDGGDAGHVKAKNGGTAITGDGGKGGNGNGMGLITTGYAYAKAKVFTVTNTNITKIKVKKP